MQNKSKQWTLGLVMLGFVVLLWVMSSFLVEAIFESDLYRKPFFITYINTATFIFYLFPTFKQTLNNYFRTGKFNLHEELLIEEEGALLPTSGNQADKLSLPETIKLSANFCILWFMANLVTNASLSYTSVGSQTILSSTSSFFTLIIGGLVAIEQINTVKVLGCLISFAGIVVVTRNDNPKYGVHTANWTILLGNLLALAGAAFYGIYTTLLKLKIKDESRVNMKIFFGFVGLFNLILLWPTLIVLHYTGVERFELPSSWFVIGCIVSNCVITFISDFCWARAMLLTSPLTVTVGLSTTIPFAMLGDVLFKGVSISTTYLLGALLIGASFFIINRAEEEDN